MNPKLQVSELRIHTKNSISNEPCQSFFLLRLDAYFYRVGE